MGKGRVSAGAEAGGSSPKPGGGALEGGTRNWKEQGTVLP